MRIFQQLLFIFMLLAPGALLCQSFGLVISDDHYKNQPELKSTDGSKTTLEELENTHIFSLKEFCPTPRNQGSSASCVGWAVGYAAQTIRKAYQEAIKEQSVIDEIAFSPYFIYNQIKLKGCALGAEIPDALRFIMTSGNVQNNVFKEGADNCYVAPKSSHYRDAQANKIPDYRKIFAPPDARLEKINSVKLALLNGLPVVVAMTITESFFKLGKGEKTWYSEIGSGTPLGAHALVVIGYNEIENTFEIMNSWGTDWANDGFAWVRYDDFVEFAKYGFTFFEGENQLTSVLINFKRKSLITKDNEVSFTDELFSHQDLIYTPVHTVATRNSDYKIEIKHSSTEYQLYCFNKSGTGTYNLFFELNQDIFNQSRNTSKYGFTMPREEYGSIRLTDPESEHFVFIIAKEPLNKDLLEELNKQSNIADLRELFASHPGVDENCRYAYNKVGFISELQENAVVILPVHFDYGGEQ